MTFDKHKHPQMHKVSKEELNRTRRCLFCSSCRPSLLLLTCSCFLEMSVESSTFFMRNSFTLGLIELPALGGRLARDATRERTGVRAEDHDGGNEGRKKIMVVAMRDDEMKKGV